MRTHKNLYLGRYAWTMMLTGALFFTSCTEDTILEEHQIEMSGEGIYFGLTETNNSWEPDSRSAKKGDKFVMRSEESTDTLCVSTSTINGIHTSNDVQSRGARKNDLVESGFNVTAYYYPAGASTPSSILFNEDVTVADGGSTSMTTTYYWPKEGGFTFLATANGDNLTIIDKNEDEGFVTTPSLSYTVPGNVSDQKDAMVAFTGTTTINNNNNGAAVPLTFTHLCAAVQFQLTSEVDNIIESIVISGVKGGTLTYTYNSNGVWEPSDLTEDASYTIETTQDGTTITSDNNGTTLLLAPQTLTADATITVNFSDGRAAVSTEADALTGNVWEMGKTFIYKLTITPEYTITINEVDTQDAHYVSCNTTVSVTDMPDNKTWVLTATANDGAAVSIQFEDDVHSYIKDEGFWLDRLIVDGTDVGSARGGNSLSGTGSGNYNIRIFLPENATDEDRNITLNVSINGESNSIYTRSFTQKCPAWDNNNLGWEQIDDKESGEYGFNWDRKVAYILPYNLSNVIGDYTEGYTYNEADALISSIIEQHNASSYASWHSYKCGFLNMSTRYYILIDYNKIGLGDKATSDSDGLKNTKELNSLAGTAATSALEQALQNTYKTETNHEHEKLFRLPGNDDPDSVPRESGSNNLGSGIINYILKKNKYNLSRETAGIGLTESPIIDENDIVWYIPASGQYTSSFEAIDGLSEDTHWSSTANSTNNTYAHSYTSGAVNKETQRTSTHFIRAVRNHP